jgi:hypothetical protein
LWYYYNAKEKIPPPDAATRALFDRGHEIGKFALGLFPGGIEVAPGVIDMDLVTRLSLQAVKLRKPLFEAGFRFGDAFARADILDPVGSGLWDLYEVKSSPVKEVNLLDLSLQLYVYESAGLSIRRCFVLYPKQAFKSSDGLSPDEVFEQKDVSEDVEVFRSEVHRNLEGMLETVSSPNCPQVSVGTQCEHPYRCVLYDVCRE